jgi:DNA-binding LytR/AlgR family response regulator
MSGVIKIAIVEDELIIAESIKLALESYGYKVLEPVINFTFAIQRINEEKPDLVFIDIRLSGSKDGIDLANEINAHYNLPFIYLTSNSDPRTVDRAKRTFPSAYLSKPFNKTDLYTAVELAVYNYQTANNIVDDNHEQNLSIRDYVFIKKSKAFVKLYYDEILYINCNHVYIELNTVCGQKYLIRSSLTDYLEILPPSFVKVHRSYAINTKHIVELSGNEVIMQGCKIPVSREFRKNISSFIGLQ